MQYHKTVLILLLSITFMISCLVVRKITRERKPVAPFVLDDGSVDWEKFNAWNSNEVARMEKKL